jgi:hypothetical protein
MSSGPSGRWYTVHKVHTVGFNAVWNKKAAGRRRAALLASGLKAAEDRGPRLDALAASFKCTQLCQISVPDRWIKATSLHKTIVGFGAPQFEAQSPRMFCVRWHAASTWTGCVLPMHLASCNRSHASPPVHREAILNEQVGTLVGSRCDFADLQHASLDIPALSQSKLKQSLAIPSTSMLARFSSWTWGRKKPVHSRFYFFWPDLLWSPLSAELSCRRGRPAQS